VTYDVEEKRHLLGVGEDAVAAGVVSEDMARAMARGVRDRLGVDVGVSVTGAAGPDPHDGVGPGTMVIGVSTPEDTRARTLRFPGDRERVRTYATTSALHLVRLALSGTWWKG
jgi:PncC family amidohydrolase